MQIALVGLGKMGGNMVKRLLGGGHHVVGMDRDAAVVDRLTKECASLSAQNKEGRFEGATSLEDMVKKLSAPRAVWVMVPAGQITEDTIQKVASLLSPNDVVIDGGNSNFRDSMRRSQELAKKQIRFLDAGRAAGSGGSRSATR